VFQKLCLLIVVLVFFTHCISLALLSQIERAFQVEGKRIFNSFRAVYGVAHIYFEAIPLERFDDEIRIFLDGTSNMICHSASSRLPFYRLEGTSADFRGEFTVFRMK
jgi:hypothetical protein